MPQMVPRIWPPIHSSNGLSSEPVSGGNRPRRMLASATASADQPIGISAVQRSAISAPVTA